MTTEKTSSQSASEKAKAPTPEHETACMLILPADGSSVIADGKVQIQGFTTKRQATWDDVYRMVCDVKSQLEAMRTVSHQFNQMKQMAMAAKSREPGLILPGGKA